MTEIKGYMPDARPEVVNSKEYESVDGIHIRKAYTSIAAFHEASHDFPPPPQGVVEYSLNDKVRH